MLAGNFFHAPPPPTLILAILPCCLPLLIYSYSRILDWSSVFLPSLKLQMRLPVVVVFLFHKAFVFFPDDVQRSSQIVDPPPLPQPHSNEFWEEWMNEWMNEWRPEIKSTQRSSSSVSAPPQRALGDMNKWMNEWMTSRDCVNLSILLFYKFYFTSTTNSSERHRLGFSYTQEIHKIRHGWCPEQTNTVEVNREVLIHTELFFLS